jgi:two-component system sensor kinase FixL
MIDIGLLKAIYERVSDGIVIVDEGGSILCGNPAACLMLGYTAKELAGQAATQLFSHYDQLRADCRSGEVKARRKSGDNFTARLSVSELGGPDRQLYAGLIHDLSREKQTAEKFREYTSGLEVQVEERTKFLKNIVRTLEQAKDEVNISLTKEKKVNRLKTRFISIASHEFRTPLSSIQLSATLIERYYDQLNRSKVFEHLRKIKLAVGDLTTILEDFLSIEKIDSGGVEPQYSEFDLPGFCEDLLTEMRPQARVGQILTYNHEGASSKVLLDKKLLRHSLTNLLSNALKYSGNNGAIHLTTMITPAGCRISVADNGIGIPKEEQGHLFEAFFRAHNTTAIQGTGLGLNIVKRYMDLMNGRIVVESVEHTGTTVMLSFPADAG